jgi:hypothetical protein
VRVYYDCEFLEDGRTIELISIGMVAEDGREYYAVNSDAPWDRIKGNDWLVRNVLTSLPMAGWTSLDTYVKHPSNVHPRPSIALVAVDTGDSRVRPHWVIANEVRDFLGRIDGLELWAWYGAYDHVVLAQLWGPMIALPEGIPMWTNDLRQEYARCGLPEDEPAQPDGIHNALADARHLKVRAEWLAAQS